MLSCLILSHGSVAEAYVEASNKILGECESLYTLGCDDLPPKRLHDEIAHLIEEKNLRDGLFILVSLRGGSCWNVAAAISREYDKIELLSGLNLSQVLCFATKNSQYAFEDFGEVLLKDGIRGVTRLSPPEAQQRKSDP
jgi:mannose/fructose-specific phosphotransferase system component IIA